MIFLQQHQGSKKEKEKKNVGLKKKKNNIGKKKKEGSPRVFFFYQE
jgi:hypothetical protein